MIAISRSQQPVHPSGRQIMPPNQHHIPPLSTESFWKSPFEDLKSLFIYSPQRRETNVLDIMGLGEVEILVF